MVAVQAGESEKQKSYTAVCQLPTPVTPEIINVINSTKDLELHQQTPVRVSHRRADLVRLRTVYAMKCEPVPGSSHHLVLQLRTQVCLTCTYAMLTLKLNVALTLMTRGCKALWRHTWNSTLMTYTHSLLQCVAAAAKSARRFCYLEVSL